MDEKAAEQLRAFFPKLDSSQQNWRITSARNNEYNCIAWAAENDQLWWDPFGPYFWPISERSSSPDCFVKAFKTLNYELCSSFDYEEAIQKVAIFVLKGAVTHMARQLPSGLWTSKCGKGEDIEHRLEDLNGELYGEAQVCLMRQSS